MIIIGNISDFFDQFIYQYGIDEKIRIDRTKPNTAILDENNIRNFLSNQRYFFGKIKNQYYTKYIDIIKNMNEYDYKGNYLDPKYRVGYFYFDDYIYPIYTERGDSKLNFIINPKTSNVFKVKVSNEYDLYKVKDQSILENQPYLFSPNVQIGKSSFTPMSSIKDINTIFEYKSVYQIIERFMMKHDTISNQSNDNKIESHGFHLKESFRHRK